MNFVDIIKKSVISEFTGTITVDNVNYTVWLSNSTAARTNVMMSQVVSDSFYSKYK